MYELKIKLSNEKSFRIRLNKKYVFIPTVIILTLLGMFLIIVGGSILIEYLNRFYDENPKGSFEFTKQVFLFISILVTVFSSIGLFIWLGLQAHHEIDWYIDYRNRTKI